MVIKTIYLLLLIPFFLLAQTTVFYHTFDYAPSNYQSNGQNDENAWVATIGSPSIDLSQGSLLYYEAAEGWSGGCAKFYPHNNSRCGFEEFPVGSWTRMNMRFLVFFNEGFYANRGVDEIKWTITNSSARTWISIRGTTNFGCGWDDELCLNYNETLFGVHGCTNTNCGSYPWNDVPNGECTANWTNYQANPFKINNYEGEWVCVEWEQRADGTKIIYIWTADSVYTDEYLMTTTGLTGNIISFDCTWINDSAGNNSNLVFWRWDEMKIVANGSDPIGPPDGFYDEIPTPDDDTPPVWTQTFIANGNDSVDIAIASISSDIDTLLVAHPDSSTTVKTLLTNTDFDTTISISGLGWKYLYGRGVDDSSNVNPFASNIDSVYYESVTTLKADTVFIIQQ